MGLLFPLLFIDAGFQNFRVALLSSDIFICSEYWCLASLWQVPPHQEEGTAGGAGWCVVSKDLSRLGDERGLVGPAGCPVL